MKRHLFQKTTLKLTGVYLGVLLFISLIFSMVIFRISTQELDRTYRRAITFTNRFGNAIPDPWQQGQFVDERAADRVLARHRVFRQLLTLNLVIVVCGGVLSYMLARRTLEPIEEAHTALERFTSDASHELRTPLTTMRTEIEVALMNPKLSPKEVKQLLASNLEEVDRLSLLSERLLMLARLEEHSLPKDSVEVVPIVEQAVAAVDARADAKKIKLSYSVPKRTKDLVVVGDAASLSEVLIILLDNAIKYSADGTQVTVDVGRDHGMVRIAVKDEGAGIAPDDILRIFDRFYRADASRTKNAQHGYGLGLPLAKKIITVHAGRIDVVSQPGTGSTFTVSLPLAG